VGEQDDIPGKPAMPQRNESPLADGELREIRELMEAERRIKWFWATTRQAAIWAAAVVGMITVGWDMLVRFVLYVAGK